MKFLFSCICMKSDGGLLYTVYVVHMSETPPRHGMRLAHAHFHYCPGLFLFNLSLVCLQVSSTDPQATQAEVVGSHTSSGWLRHQPPWIFFGFIALRPRADVYCNNRCARRGSGLSFFGVSCVCFCTHGGWYGGAFIAIVHAIP